MRNTYNFRRQSIEERNQKLEVRNKAKNPVQVAGGLKQLSIIKDPISGINNLLQDE